MIMDIKTEIVQRIITTAGDVIAGQLSQPDWESRRKNISEYYKDLSPIMDTLPDAPAVREIPEQRGEMDEIIDQICTPDLSPKESLECRECVEEVVKGPSDVMQKYFESSISQKAGDDTTVDPEQLRIGIKVEMEHTDDPQIAEKIARDHLMEISDYYTRLIKMEKEALKSRIQK